MAQSIPKVSAPSKASALPPPHTTSAAPRSPPDCRSTDPGTVKIPEPIVVPTTMRTRSRSVRTRASCRGAGADISELRGNSRRDLAGSSRPADVGRPQPGSERRLYRALEVAGRPGSAELLEHQRAREDGRHRVGDPFARERRRRAVHRLEQPPPPPPRGGIGPGGQAHPAPGPGPPLPEDVAAQVRGHDD